MSTADEARETAGSPRALAQFVLSGLVAVALLGLAAVEVMRRSGTQEAVREAKQVTRLAGDGIVAPRVNRALLSGDPDAIRSMDVMVHRSVLGGSVVRVKLWRPDGRIVYSDEHRLIGQRFEIGAEEREALEHQTVDAEVSDLTEPENRYERREKKLLEVYLGIRGTEGSPLLFEAYNRFSSVSASGRRLWLVFAPALIGAMLLLEAAQVPLAWSLLRRLRRGQREREELLQRALDAAENERSRIARDLHDGTVQQLAGVSFTLAAAADKLERRGQEEEAGLVEQAADETRRSVRELRTLLVDLYPPTLHQQGLAAALADLLAPLASRGLVTDLRADPALRLPENAERVMFRAAQEALRNVVKHADAERVDVAVDRRNGSVALTVADDGRGGAAPGEVDGHFGLRIVQDLARDAGGEFRLEHRPEGGTLFRFEVPAS
ncbi:MAG: integral membrane sensor signal transduction histidine kinase [Actinobacteria bacterium]|nr:MAG: integral membrane sensor signal transduction histidine kinase [Actinomycetota bacterium]